MMTKMTKKEPARWAALALLLALLQGCATGPNAHPNDPFEPFNRSVFNFNDGVDRAIIKPVAIAYRDITPAPVRTGVTSFFGNISDIWSFVNNVLQAKPEAAADSFFRVTVNTLWGVGGIFDVASDLNIQKHSEDFGRTLGYWGMASGPYLVLPLLGPSTVRDSVGTAVDIQGGVMSHVDNVPVRNSLTGLRAVNTRSNFLGTGEALEQAALDKYSFARDIYLQRHRGSRDRAREPEVEERYDLPEVVPGVEAPAAPASPAQ